MKLSPEVIGKVNQTLGIEGRPRWVSAEEGWVEMEAYIWSAIPTYDSILAELSSEFIAAFGRAQQHLLRSHTKDRTQTLREFFAEEPAHIQAEFKQYESKLERLENPASVLPEPPEISPELQAATERISSQIDKSEYMHGDNFDLDAYTAIYRAAWEAAELHEFDEELAEIRAWYEQYQSTFQQLQSDQETRLQKTRALLADEPVVVYGDVIVLPSSDPFDILRFEETDGANFGIQTEDVIARLQVLDEQFGIDIIDAGFDYVVFLLKHAPEANQVTELKTFLTKLCPDIEDAQAQISAGKIELWWD